MKKLIIVLLTLVSLTTKAQSVPTFDSEGNITYYVEDTIKLPYSVAKQIAKDLISGDSAKAELGLVQQQLTLTNKVVVLKDSIIASYVQKCDIYDQRIINEQSKFSVQGQYVSQLEKSVKKLKAKLTITRIVSIAITGFLGYLYLTK